ncbi:MAG: polysaccharide biosynthesis protein [bacterium]
MLRRIKFFNFFSNFGNLFLIVSDFWLIFLSLLFSTFLRFDFIFPKEFFFSRFSYFSIYSLLVVISLLAFGDYEEKWEYASFREYVRFIIVFSVINLFFGLFFFLAGGELLPRSVIIISFFISLFLLFSFRVILRGLREFSENTNKTKVLIVLNEKNLDYLINFLKNLNYEIVGLIFDDLKIRGRVLKGIPVYYDLNIIKKLPIKEIYIDKDVNNEIYEKVIQSKTYDIAIKKIENISFNNYVIQNIRVEDLIMREKRDIEIDISNYKNRVYLITGAAGSIGKYIFKELLNLKVSKIIGIDISEEGIHNLILETEYYTDTEKKFVLIDINDKNISKYIKGSDIIFHCAAKKHLPLVEENKYLAFKTNVLGTLNILENINLFKQRKEFVFISTDKAVNPTSFMGLTKRIGEILTIYYSIIDRDNSYIVVRFGNVFGSSGSLIPSIIKQIDLYNRVKVTDINVRRYFMLPNEAAKLIIFSLINADSSDIVVLDMGQSINIYELTKKIIQLLNYNKNIPIEIIGLRKGEKLNEELFYNYESIKDKKRYIYIINHNLKIKENISKIQDFIDFVKNYDLNLDNINDLEQVLWNFIKELEPIENFKNLEI